MNKSHVQVGGLLALLGLLWSAATQWQELKDRVKTLEDRERYEHGVYTVPKEK